MELLSKILLYLHIAAGATTLLAGPIAIWYNERDPRKHRLVGQVFYWAMVVVCTSSVIGFIQQPHNVFYQFLLGIAVFVGAGILRGVRAIQLMKGGTVSRFDFAYTAMLAVGGVAMLALSAWHFSDDSPALSILFLVFGLGSLSDVRINLRMFRHPEAQHRLDWLRLHVGSMIGAFMASSTAFTVNVAHGLPWYLQWFGPTLALLPLQIYFGRKIKQRKARLLGTA